MRGPVTARGRLRRRAALAALACAALGLALGPGPWAPVAPAAAEARPRFKVIVHPKNPVTRASRELLRNAYLKKLGAWSHGEALRPVDLARKFPARDHFARDIVGKTPAQLRSYWSQQIFSGKRTPPPEASAVADMIAYVLASPGAVGYLPADADAGGAKVVEVE